MLFSSTIFIFYFLPVVLLIYYLVPKQLKNLVILISSVLFYTWGENILVLVMLLSLTVDYVASLIISKGYRRAGLGLSILINLLFLSFFKYYNFFLDSVNSVLDLFGLQLAFAESSLTLPIGISFYTFQSMSYTIDVYRGEVKATRNFLQLATYVTMFPQLVAGPIVRYIDIQKQLMNKDISVHNFYTGIRRFIYGLAKKVLIANPCGYIADGYFGTDLWDLSTPMAWIGILCYSLQIYFDFSGYSDMAIGLGKTLGFNFLENFNFPYIAKSIREFWRRWHISLSTWFRDYVYISLGGNRKGKSRVYLNLLIVFFVTGLWHGASMNFVVWGFFHGFFIVLERAGLANVLSKIWRPIQHLYTLLVVLIGWVFFKADDLDHALFYIRRLFVYSSGDPALMTWYDFKYLNIEAILVIILGVLLSTPIIKKTSNYFFSKRPSSFTFVGEFGFLIFLFVMSCSYIVSNSYNPFIYFRF